MTMKESTIEEINAVMEESWNAFEQYRKLPFKQRAEFMRAIAREISDCEKELIETASQETNLTEARLKSELTRTIYQLNNYAEATEKAQWMDIRIDHANTDRNPPRPDLRKTMVPLGPVVVFGASNFPFAYSTAGGDTACAFAAGCSVVVKAHPGHEKTSEKVAEAILKAAADTYMPSGIFGHVFGSEEAGHTLVNHHRAKAVGFTGSYSGGRALFDLAAKRKDPIPVFAEMGSVNPVFLLPGKMKELESIAKMYGSSITLGTGQFCTNPGLIFGIDNADLQEFIIKLGEEIRQTVPGTMLHTGIFNSYVEKRALALSQEEVEMVSVSEKDAGADQGIPTIATTKAQAYLNNPILHQEVFGPYSMVVKCKDINEMTEVAMHTEGQLTATIMGTEEDIANNPTLIEAIRNICGRLVLNGVPTGVEVSWAMHHGGPFPATTDPRFTSVGSDAIKRFARPISYQNWNNSLLPDELKEENPLGLTRMVNGNLKNS